MASQSNNDPFVVGILTVSDRCHQGTQEDKSGPNLKSIVEQKNGLAAVVVKTKIVPDETKQIKDILVEWSDKDKLDLILTTGGTGFAERDVTPEATKEVLEKEAPGLALSMLMGSLNVTPLAMLSRPACGIRGKSLILNLPGSKKGAQECFEFVLPALPHAIQLLRGDNKKVESTHKSMMSAVSHDQPASHQHRRIKIRRSKGHHFKTLSHADTNLKQVSGKPCSSVQDSQAPVENAVLDLRAKSNLVIMPQSSQVQTVHLETSLHPEASPFTEGDETGVQINRILKALSQHISEIDDGRAEQAEQSRESFQDGNSEIDLTTGLDKQSKLRIERMQISTGKRSPLDGFIYVDANKEDVMDVEEQDEDEEDDDDARDDGTSDDNTIIEDDRESYSSGFTSLHLKDGESGKSLYEDREAGNCKKSLNRRGAKSPGVSGNTLHGNKEQSEHTRGEKREDTYVVFEFDPTDIEPKDGNEEPQTKKQRIIALPRPFGKSQRQLRAGKKSSKSKTKRKEKKSKQPNQTEYSIPVGSPLRNFLTSQILLKDVTLKRGKRAVKRDLVTLQRQENAAAAQTWHRGGRFNERCCYDDLFVATEKGNKLLNKMKRGGKDQYVVMWYLWCPGKGNCQRKCGGQGKCSEGCKGARHKQDRHNCSVLVTLKLFLSDLHTWKVTITGQHVPQEGTVTWQSSKTQPQLSGRELVTDIIYTQCPHSYDIPDMPVEHHDINKVARRPRTSPYPLIPYIDAYNLVQHKAPILHQCSVKCQDALGYILASDVTAQHPLPPFRASIKDGYAVIASDGPGSRRVLSDSLAGELPKSEVIPGYVIRITTGAPVPAGADAVVEVENTELLKESDGGEMELEVNILCDPIPGQDIRPIGLDIPLNQVILRRGVKLGPSELGLLAAVGVTHAPVYQKPTVAVMSTGNELCEPHKTLRKGHIFDSNRTTLLSALRDHGFPCLDMGIAKDTEENLKSTLKSAADQADVIISTGGVSMGERDLLKYCLMVGLHAKVHFGRVLLKPGKPTTFATISSKSSQKLFFALPGNPVSALVTFELFVLPALRKMMGTPKPGLTKIKARVASDIKLDPRPEFQRVKLAWDEHNPIPKATTTGSQMSSRLLSMSEANALLMLPPETEVMKEMKEGAIVDALLIGKL